jgi:hypothetical protein
MRIRLRFIKNVARIGINLQADVQGVKGSIEAEESIGSYLRRVSPFVQEIGIFIDY